jgi:alkylation response protein AidB-like acyl-CoA dehydrogenase
MRFHLSSEQIAIQDTLRGALTSVFPKERLHQLADSDSDFDRESWDALMALGLGGLAIPETDGGSGLGLLDAAISVEVLGQGAAPGPIAWHLLAGLAVAASSNQTARENWLAKLVSGEAVATLALGAAWLPEGWTATVDHGALTGKARFVPSAASADLFLVGLKGGGLALVEAGEGVTVTPVKSTDRTRRLSSVAFSSAKATVLFAAGDPQVQRLFDASLVLVAADALGGAQYCVDLSVEYAKVREQFGQPIARFQALKHQLATIALEVEPARALLWYAAYAYDSGQPDASRAAALAKAHICDRYVSVARGAVAAHGGIGYTWEYGLNYWFRRSVFDRAFLGSPAVHRARAADLAGW